MYVCVCVWGGGIYVTACVCLSVCFLGRVCMCVHGKNGQQKLSTASRLVEGGGGGGFL